MPKKICYYCGATANSREHYPAKAFFPRKSNLKLRTVPSCALHNSGKSNDDQYVLAHICMNAAKEENLAKRVFKNAIVPQLQLSEGFRRRIVDGSESLENGIRKYAVDVARFDRFFDSLVRAEFFERYNINLCDNMHKMSHSYLDFLTDDPVTIAQNKRALGMLNDFFVKHEHLVENFEADKLDEIIYANQIVDPAGPNASITIAHTFYGVFRVVSYITRIWPADIDAIFQSYTKSKHDDFG